MYNDSYIDITATGTGDMSALGALTGIFAGVYIVALIISIIGIIAMWKIFTKAGIPGWKSIIPIYNTYVLFEMVGLKGWYIFLSLIPFVGGIILFVFTIIAMVNLAKCFGKSGGFAVGLIFLTPIFYLILAFDSSTYLGNTKNNM